ncbi:MAG: metal ABC transporter permease [Chlamydiia bacterium]|nr:metal ABC transporter permease [Chlamydiia bacterium]
MSAYWGATFFEFFAVLFSRCMRWVCGAPLRGEADELQLGVLLCIAISCGLVGPFLVLKRMTMLANALSHTVLLGVVSAFLLTSFLWDSVLFSPTTLLFGAMTSALLTAWITEGLTRVFRLQEDASVNLVFSSLFALGVLLVSLYTRNVHLGVEAVMGSVDMLQGFDLQFSVCLAGLNSIVIALFYRQFQISSFDRSYAAALGIPAGFFHFLLLFLTSLVCVSAFRAVGVLLVLALLVGPYLTARIFIQRLAHLLIVTPLLGMVCALVGVALSRHFLSVYGIPLSTGGLVVCVIGLLYAICAVIRGFRVTKVYERA